MSILIFTLNGDYCLYSEDGKELQWTPSYKMRGSKIHSKDGIMSFSYLNVEGRLCPRSEWSGVPVNLLRLLPRGDKEFSGTLISKNKAYDIVIGVCVYKKRSTVFHIVKNVIS